MKTKEPSNTARPAASDQGRGRGPGHLVGVDDGVDQAEQAAGDRDGPGDVQPPAVALGPRLDQRDPGEDEEDDADGDVHEQDPPPREELGEDPAEEGTGGTTPCCDRRPRPERLGPCPLVGEGDGQDGQGGRRRTAAPTPCNDRAAMRVAWLPANPPRRLDAVKSASPTRKIRRRPKMSARRPPRSSRPPKVSTYDGDHPLEARGAESEVLLDRGERHVHDGDVQDHHELGQADDDQDEGLGPAQPRGRPPSPGPDDRAASPGAPSGAGGLMRRNRRGWCGPTDRWSRTRFRRGRLSADQWGSVGDQWGSVGQPGVGIRGELGDRPGRLPDTMPAMVTCSRTARRLARTATHTACRCSAAPS